MKAKWARHYKIRASNATHIMEKKRRRDKMARLKSKSKDVKKEERKQEGITPEKYFVLSDGRPIKSVEELALMLDSISDEDYSRHVNDEKNDFACWIKDVFGFSELADSLMSVKSRKDSQIVLLKHAVGGRR